MKRLWAANAHEYGPGKVHIIDDEAPHKTMCGRFTDAVPGKETSGGKATCRSCLNAVEARPERKRAQAEWDARIAEEKRVREQQNQEWWERYTAYLQTPQWRQRRALVIKRCDGICEGCAIQKATQVHHLTYEHMGAEFLWELRGICNDCHDRCHSETEPQ